MMMREPELSNDAPDLDDANDEIESLDPDDFLDTCVDLADLDDDEITADDEIDLVVLSPEGDAAKIEAYAELFGDQI
jgi:hypothetical protein